MRNIINRKKIRNYVSCITNEQCAIYRKASISVQPINKPICKKLDTHSVVKLGSRAMKADGYVLIQGVTDV